MTSCGVLEISDSVAIAPVGKLGFVETALPSAELHVCSEDTEVILDTS